MKKLALALALALVPRVAAAEDIEAKPMRGVKTIAVKVENLDPDLEKEGVSKGQLQTEIELRLRKAGLTVKDGAASYFYVRVSSMKDEEQYALGFSVEFLQPVVVVSNKVRTVATTWDRGGIGVCGKKDLDCVSKYVARFVDEFLNDFLSVNPPPKPIRE